VYHNANSKQNKRLREYPTGMSLAVPLLPNSLLFGPVGGAYIASTYAPVETTKSAATPASLFEKVKFNPSADEIVFHTPDKCPVRPGDWIVLMCNGTGGFSP
jgi:hypothetical protein